MPKLILHSDDKTAVQSKNLVEEMYAGLQNRFSRTRPAEPIVYEFTNERGLLHQYYRIREIMYRKVHNTTKFDGKEDVHDKIAHILIARRGKLVIGGCRLIVREGDEDFLLPMEDENFKVRDVFSHLPLRNLRHCEVSRFAVIDNDDEQLAILVALSRLIYDKCVNAEVAYAFIKAPGIFMARSWRKIIQSYSGQKDVRICTDIKISQDTDYPEIE